jgi:hypothetical protein
MVKLWEECVSYTDLVLTLLSCALHHITGAIGDSNTWQRKPLQCWNRNDILVITVVGVHQKKRKSKCLLVLKVMERYGPVWTNSFCHHNFTCCDIQFLMKCNVYSSTCAGTSTMDIKIETYSPTNLQVLRCHNNIFIIFFFFLGKLICLFWLLVLLFCATGL